ncbi:MAG TPA: proline dehydrogenase family protein [Anaerolineaceae bacterium]|nr:proline dehydrogenase family protein [Anaerolineaceae bacterium]
MMRSFLISLSRAEWARRMMTRLRFVRRMARRFVAGETPEEAIQAVSELNGRGILATLDHLGENTQSLEEAHQATRQILAILDEIQRAGVQANISIKLSQIGLALDHSACLDNLGEILETAGKLQNFIRLDMEDATLTTRTLEIYAHFRDAGYENLGVVIQAYLYRSEEDIRSLGARGARVRLCKGAYQEPASIAFPKKADVDANYDRLAGLLVNQALEACSPPISADRRTPPIPAFATHDPRRIAHAREAAGRMGLPMEAVEFQMLYGIRRDLQDELARQGYPVRVYVPYGSHWYPYLMRRLAERPANLWFFAANFLRK